MKPREYEDVLEIVMSKIYEHEIWIPDYEVEKYYKGKINGITNTFYWKTMIRERY
ncbi:transposase [Bacillus thuringiensis serovar sotto str. T04001]|nr:transposase [Bacillus thuringiensis serovar sotto str. T04001]